ncbi:MAG: helix-turn-helix domain-containing protein [Proteobacteria bacterium]|nr:helix-turn-helix domain-containing protein [Pseudomonadota bacterium]
MRRREGLTQNAFADRLGLKTGVLVSYWETEKRKPGTNHLLNICDEFNINSTWLLNGEGSDDGRTPEFQDPSMIERKRREYVRSPPDHRKQEASARGTRPFGIFDAAPLP